MKEKHTVFLKKYLYRYIIFFIVFGLFVKIGNIFAQKQESVFIEQKIMLSAFQDPSLKTNKVRIRLRETSMNLLQFSKNNHVIGYAYLMDTQINNQKSYGLAHNESRFSVYGFYNLLLGKT